MVRMTAAKLWTNLKEVYSRRTTKSTPLLQSENGFYQHNRPEHGQVHEWYPTEKMVIVLVCLNIDVVLQGV